MEKITLRNGIRLMAFVFLAMVATGAWISPAAAQNSQPSQGYGISPPQLVDVYAPGQMPAGGIWRVYLEGYDPDGDMERIHAVVSQLEGERWYSQIITLDAGEGGHFAGYLSLQVPYFNGTSTVVVKLTIVDHAGNKSESREERVRIGYTSNETLPEKWLAVAGNRIANLFFKVRDPYWDNSNDVNYRP